MSNFHLQLMAALTNKIASFFNLLSDTCMRELSKPESKDPPAIVSQPLLLKKETYEKTDTTNAAHKSDTEINRQFDEEPKPVREIEQKRRKGRPKNKDKAVSHKPKAPTSSYLIYFHENKHKIATKYNVTSIGDIAKLASNEWRHLPEEEKAKYIQLSAEEQVRYHEQMEVYKQSYAEEIEATRRKKLEADELKRRRKEIAISKQAIKAKKESSSSSNSSSSSSSSSKPKQQPKGKEVVIFIDDSSLSSKSSGKKDYSLEV